MVRSLVVALTITVAISGSFRLEAQGFARRLSVCREGAETNDGSGAPSLSKTGDLVAFQSYASNLVPNDTNACCDVFLHDRRTGATRRVSVSSDRVEGDLWSGEPSISADGRFVAFASHATNLVPNDTNGAADVFVHDVLTGRTYRVSTGPAGAPANGPSGRPSISRDGRQVAFESLASNLVAGDHNGALDVFVRDRDALTTLRISVDAAGEGDADSGAPSISYDGKSVAFTSYATRFAQEPDVDADVFLWEAKGPRLTLVSVDAAGRAAGGDDAAISGDGAVVAFTSAARLRDDDLNPDRDVYAFRVATKRMMLASVSTSGQPGKGFAATRDFGPSARIQADSSRPTLSADGRYVAFTSLARGLVPGAIAGAEVYLRDLGLGVTRCVSADATGRFSAAPCSLDDVIGGVECPPVVACLSGDATRVGIQTQGAMAAGDANGEDDVYLVLVADSFDASAKSGRVQIDRQPK